MHIAFSRTDHRSWPVPEGRWTWRQSWKDLLFAHWRVPAATLQPLVPPELKVQEFDGSSWVGVVPFRMSGVMRRFLPNLPWLSAFPELNLRLYVERDGKPGVWFLSLDAANRVAVWAAKRFFHLPYFFAKIAFERQPTRYQFSSQRPDNPAISFRAEYAPTSAVFEAAPGSLEAFLTERYCLYTKTPSGKLLRADVHHVPWPLQQATGELEATKLVAPHGFSLNGPPLLHFSTGVDVVIWPMVQLSQQI
ncbi:MAG: DUF2071 domain-containing protein [Zavarzinella sp.]